ncbi:MAG: hypothetical protein R8G34_07945 [Paracoccaceae bacterium]|nr:hypothetical protein [Paracoccaceae bacterium]
MIRILISILMTLSVASCGVPLTTQDRTRISALQATYDRDFREAIAADGLDVGKERFSRTLAALPSETTGQSDALTGFYTLLEGMIYLQTGQLGLAQAIAPEVAAAADNLNTDGIERRNVILANNYAALVAGRSATASLAQLTSNSTEQQAQRLAIVRDIETRTEAVSRRLCRAGSVDEGAAVVAAYQASFLVEADRALAQACIPIQTDAAACAGFLGNRVQLQDARNLMAAFAGSISGTSQIADIQRQIESDLLQSQDGQPLAAPDDPCK